MRGMGSAIILFLLAACSSGGGTSATLVLKNRYWDQVRVEAVLTTLDDCNSRAQGYVKTERFTLKKGDTHAIVAPQDQTICWRHDANPNHPVPGLWSGWSKAILFPGQRYKTSL